MKYFLAKKWRPLTTAERLEGKKKNEEQKGHTLTDGLETIARRKKLTNLLSRFKRK